MPQKNARGNNKPRKQTPRSRGPLSANRQLQQNAKATNTSRTTNSTQVALRASNTRSSGIPRGVVNRLPAYLDHDYIRCRLEPLAHSGGSGLNDGSLGVKLIYECRQYTDIIIGSTGAVAIAIVPWAPFPVLIKPNGTAAGTQITVNGTAIAQGAIGANFTHSWVAGTITQAFNDIGPNTAINTGLTAGASRARLISQAWKLGYSGQASQCAGIMNVASSDVDLVEFGPSVAATPILQPADGSTVAAGGSIGFPLLMVKATTSPSVYGPNTVQCRPEDTCHGTLKHRSKTYNFRDTFGLAYNTQVPGVNANFIAGVSSNNSGLQFWDNDWESLLIVGSSLTATTTFRLEYVQCFEVIPSLGSNSVPLSRQPGKNNELSATLVDAFLERAPVSMPANKSYVLEFLKFARDAAPLIGSAFGPQGAAVGALVASVAGLAM